jgi:hypothetical protein
MDEDPDGISISPKKQEANRRNAQLSTGPRTEEGKGRSRCNALKHGILGTALLITKGEGAEDPAEFEELLNALYDDYEPVGACEEMLVETIAVCCWRERRALRCEAGSVRRAFLESDFETDIERGSIRDHLRLPSGRDLDRILRYETAIQHKLAHAFNQLERLQRARKGERIPAPVSVQVSADQ